MDFREFKGRRKLQPTFLLSSWYKLAGGGSTGGMGLSKDLGGVYSDLDPFFTVSRYW